MFPRFSLYSDITQWNGDIREDPRGQWTRWRDMAPYVEYALAHGFIPAPLPEDEPLSMAPMVERESDEVLTPTIDDLPLDNTEDVYELITGQHTNTIDDLD